MTCLCGRNPSQVLLPPEEAGEPCRKQSNPVPFMRQILILNPSYFVLSSLFPEKVGPDALGKTAKADFYPTMNLHITLRAGQCPEVSLGAGTIFWWCSSLFSPSCWRIPGQLGCFEQLCLCFFHGSLSWRCSSAFVCVMGRCHLHLSDRFSKDNVLFEGEKGRKKASDNTKLGLLEMFLFALQTGRVMCFSSHSFQ